MTIVEFLLYLTYGFSMITMGIFASVQKGSKMMNISLIRSMKYLGHFGIIHGISEWISMILKLELCHPHLITEIYYTNLILKALSFAFLLRFGLDLLPVKDKYKSIIPQIPRISFLLYVLGFYLLIFNYGVNYHVLNSAFNTVAIRYFMAIPSCAIAAAALYLNAQIIEKTKSVQISKRYKNLACIFIAYGIVEGLLVAKADFFPANIINSEIFPKYFSFMTLSFKAIVGFIINYLLIKVIDTFSWEQEERLFQLEKQRIAAEERRKMGLEIHDTIIQELYAIGLKIEYLSKYRDRASSRDILEEVKGNISTTINKTREFISVNVDEIELDELKDSLEQLVRKYNESQSIKIILNCKISPYIVGNLLPEKTTQIYYIVQEAITNVIKHSEADYAEVLLEGRHDFIYITITDNGKGISYHDIDLEQQFGIRSMKERAQRVNGFFNIERLTKGTRIELKIPWEETSQ